MKSPKIPNYDCHQYDDLLMVRGSLLVGDQTAPTMETLTRDIQKLPGCHINMGHRLDDVEVRLGGPDCPGKVPRRPVDGGLQAVAKFASHDSILYIPCTCGGRRAGRA